MLWQALLVGELGVGTKEEAKALVKQRLGSIQNVVLDDDGANVCITSKKGKK